MQKHLFLTLKISYILLIILSFIIFYFYFSKYLNVENLSILLSNKRNFIEENFNNLIIFYIILIFFLTLIGFPMLPILISGGYIFEPFIFTLIFVMTYSFSSTIIFLILKFFFREFVLKIVNKYFKKILNFLNKNINYSFFVFKLFGGFGSPGIIQNFIPSITNIKSRNFFLISIVSTPPLVFFWSNIGYSLKIISDYEKINLNIFSDFQILFTLFLMSIFPIILKFSKQIIK